MRYEDRRVILKNGRICELFSPEAKDAAEVLELIYQTSCETNFLSRYPEERLLDVDQEQWFLDNVIADDRDVLICARVDGRIVGNVGISRIVPRIKYRHRAELGISVLQEFWGIGLGNVLVTSALDTAFCSAYEQVELEVVTDNVRAVALYEKLGFISYGSRPHSFKYKDGTYGDMELMIRFADS